MQVIAILVRSHAKWPALYRVKGGAESEGHPNMLWISLILIGLLIAIVAGW